MTNAEFELRIKPATRQALGGCGFLYQHVKSYQGKSMEVINSRTACFFRAHELLVRMRAFARGGLHLDALTFFGEPG
jgi:hypothetical protein